MAEIRIPTKHGKDNYNAWGYVTTDDNGNIKIVKIKRYRTFLWWLKSLFAKKPYLAQPKTFNSKGEEVRVTGHIYTDGSHCVFEENVKTGKVKKYKRNRTYKVEY